jgi:hypothetical protein
MLIFSMTANTSEACWNRDVRTGSGTGRANSIIASLNHWIIDSIGGGPVATAPGSDTVATLHST